MTNGKDIQPDLCAGQWEEPSDAPKEPVDDGGVAVPVPGHSHIASFNGMSLRDYFAGQAMVSQRIAAIDDKGLAKQAYAFADAMLTARKEQAND